TVHADGESSPRGAMAAMQLGEQLRRQSSLLLGGEREDGAPRRHGTLLVRAGAGREESRGRPGGARELPPVPLEQLHAWRGTDGDQGKGPIALEVLCRECRGD